MEQLWWALIFWLFLVGMGVLEYLMDPENGGAIRKRRWPINLAFGLFNGAIVTVVPVGLLALVAATQTWNIGLLQMFGAPYWLAILATVLFRDAGQYVFHRFVHSVPWFWRFHVVHHSDPHIDVSTGLRFHPVELIANILFIAPIMIVLGAPLEVLVPFEAIATLVGIYAHSSVGLPDRVDRMVRLVIVTPGLHHIHHSDLAEDFDRNYGVCFTFWDRIGGTFKGRTGNQAGKPVPGVIGMSAERALELPELVIPVLSETATEKD